MFWRREASRLVCAAAPRFLSDSALTALSVLLEAAASYFFYLLLSIFHAALQQGKTAKKGPAAPTSASWSHPAHAVLSLMEQESRLAGHEGGKIKKNGQEQGASLCHSGHLLNF